MDENAPPPNPNLPVPSQSYPPPPPPYAQPPQPPQSSMQPYAYPAAQAYGMAPVNGGYSDKSKTTAGILQLVLSILGLPGIGRLYAGNTAIGLIQLIGMLVSYFLVILLIGFLLVPAFWIWGVIDGIVMLTGNPVDGEGRPLRP